MSTIKTLKPRSRVRVKVNFANTRYCLILVLDFLSSFTSVRTPPPSHFSWLFWKDAQARHPSNSTEVSQVSNSAVAPIDSILVHRFEAWSHKSPCQATGLGSFLANAIAIQVDDRNRVVDFQCFGKGLWTKNDGKPCETWKILRTYKAICDTNIKIHKAMFTIKNLKPRSRVKVKVNFRQNKILFGDLYFNFSLAVKCQKTLPRPTFHLASIPFQWLFWKDAQARHPSNSTEVSQVSNTTATPLDSMRFHRLEVWRRRPASQAPGLCSFLANSIGPQVNVRNRLVDFQRFGKGLWTETMSNHVKPEKSWELTRRSATPT